MNEQRSLLILFGGQSSEHLISCKSVKTIASAVSGEKYDLTMVGITEDGEWRLVPENSEDFKAALDASRTAAFLLPDASKRSLLIQEAGGYREKKVDLVFPVLHGLCGEDGTVQGLLELAKIPYVGCGVLSSAISMDKAYTKQIVKGLGIHQAEALILRRADILGDDISRRVEESFPYPVFVKPSRAGSSKGVSKVHNREELLPALKEALRHDRIVLVEEEIRGRELECAVLQTENGTEVSGVGEILAAAEFYDYEAKYENAASGTIVHPDLPAGLQEEIQKASKRIFEAVDGAGFSRVDFFYSKTKGLVFNEINTIPGFTSISMYPMLFKAEGYTIETLVEALLQSAAWRE